MSVGLHAQIVAKVGRLVIDVSLDTGAGTLVLIGPNGSGKSSLLSLVMGVLPVEQALVCIGDRTLHDTRKKVMLPLEQRCLGFVPQDYALFPHLTVAENIEFALASGPTPLNRPARRLRVEAHLRELGLEGLGKRRTQTLSGGEQQRVALARALSLQPHLLLLDEPLAALDVHTRQDVRTFLAATLTKRAVPTILVTHDPADARQLAHQIAVLEEGKITQFGTWSELVRSPATHFVEAFVAGG